MPDPALSDVPVLDHMLALMAAADLRYQQRYDAQTRALDAALLAAEKAVQTALSSAKEATAKAEAAAGDRFAAVNEFRQTLTDQAATFVGRAEFEANRASVVDRVAELAARVDKTEGARAGLDSGWKILIAAATLGLALWLAFRGGG